MHPSLRLDKICFLKLMKSLSKGSSELYKEARYFSTNVTRYYLHQNHQVNLNNSSHFYHQNHFLQNGISLDKHYSNFFIMCMGNISRILPFVPSHYNTNVSFVRWYRSRTRDMRQQDSNLVEAEEVDNTVSVMDRMTPNELSDLNMKQGVVSVHEKGIEPHTSSDEVQNVDEFTLPELSRTSMSLAPYVKRSLTLQKLVMLGVDLDKVQRVKEVPELLLKSDFKKNLLPLFKFLSSIKVPVKEMGKIFTENPLLFKENIQNLELRVGYMIHKKFSLKDIASMAIRCSIFLLMDPHKLDEKLGFLQNTFQLTGQEVRHVAMTYPKILPWRQELIADVRFHIKEFIGFSDSELKEVILKEPSLYMNNKNAMVKRFEYLHNTMLLDHHQVVQWPGVLSSRMFIIKTRHMFLLSLGRAQYDPCQENFVSLKALVTGTDQEFCHNVAKCDVNKFYDFCKTI